ncbi:hypothetical protein [Luteitalea sp.]|uniref:hypothetical protein n=1 Tax=Luteitalea sp. TaxID=2004800 RepID=UPI0025BDB43B|nr:hypothetical protein [Luteitalea sp.]
MRLPRGSSAIVDIDKLTGYCLNPEHPARPQGAAVVVSTWIVLRGEEQPRLTTCFVK